MSETTLNGVMTNATAAPGVGFTNWTYGSAGSGGSLTILPNASTLDLATGSTGPLNFSNANSYTWTLFTPRNSTAALKLDSGLGNGTFLDLTNQANITALNDRLNQLLLFNKSTFFDPSGPGAPAPITASAGDFRFTFADWNATQGYQSIQLTFTPVPEPTFLLGVTAVCGFGFHRLRRRNRASAGVPVAG